MFVHQPPTQCDKKPLTTFHDGILRVDQKVHAELFKEVTQCSYKPFTVELKSVNEVTYSKAVEIDMKADNKITDQWILVECRATLGGDILYRWVEMK